MPGRRRRSSSIDLSGGGGSVNITLPSGTAGQFAFAPLASPVTLDANASYYLMSAEINGGDQFYDLGPVTTTNAASVDSGVVFWQGSGFTAVDLPAVSMFR